MDARILVKDPLRVDLDLIRSQLQKLQQRISYLEEENIKVARDLSEFRRNQKDLDFELGELRRVQKDLNQQLENILKSMDGTLTP